MEGTQGRNLEQDPGKKIIYSLYLSVSVISVSPPPSLSNWLI